MTNDAHIAPVTTRDAQYRRYSRADLSQISVKRANSPQDMDTVARLRKQGFARIAASNSASARWIDESDVADGTFSLISGDLTGQPIATMRVQDRWMAPVELERFVPLEALLTPAEHPVAQFGRLSVTKHGKAAAAMFALFKTAWYWCIEHDISTIVIATPPWAKMIYDFLSFESTGPLGEFFHDVVAAKHVVMKISVQGGARHVRASKHPIFGQLIADQHPKLR